MSTYAYAMSLPGMPLDQLRRDLRFWMREASRTRGGDKAAAYDRVQACSDELFRREAAGLLDHSAATIYMAEKDALAKDPLQVIP